MSQPKEKSRWNSTAILGGIGKAIDFGVARVTRTSGPSTGLVSTDGNYVVRPNLEGGYDICRPVAATPLTPSVLKNLARLRPAYELHYRWTVRRKLSALKSKPGFDRRHRQPPQHQTQSNSLKT